MKMRSRHRLAYRMQLDCLDQYRSTHQNLKLSHRLGDIHAWLTYIHDWSTCASRKGLIPEAKGEVTLTEILSVEVGGAGP
jgi:hypothetical protein